MGTVINEGVSGTAFAVSMIIGVLLIAGAFMSSVVGNNEREQAEAKAKAEQGCAYYRDYKTADIPAQCLDGVLKDHNPYKAN